jgi:GNAT superfamily N-acetyltransferase
MSPDRFEIRLATQADARALPEIEASAGEIFRDIPELAWIADDGGQSEERHRELIAQGTAWVATNKHGMPVGFINGEELDGNFHIWELSVHRAFHGQRIGKALIEKAKRFARDKHLHALTLTTFRDVPWNAPYYRSLGFEVVEGDAVTKALASILQKEADLGLPVDLRCAMALRL